MRDQYMKSLQRFCERRSQSSSAIRWWFSDNQSQARRFGSSEFADEHTRPMGRDPDVETQDDPPLEDAFFQQLGYG